MVAHIRRPRVGQTLLRAWVGYQRRLDEELAAAGFDDRRFPDGRILRLCARADSVTISEIGRQLGITRQGASKIVAGLRDAGYVTLNASETDAREKVVQLTGRALAFLDAQRKAVGKIERQLTDTLGAEVVDALYELLDALSDDQLPRDYLRQARQRFIPLEE